MTGRDMGRVAYEAYTASCGGLSVRGERLPDWPGQQAEIREHWRAAADAVLMLADLAAITGADVRAQRAYRAYAGVVDDATPWEGLPDWQQQGWLAAVAAAEVCR